MIPSDMQGYTLWLSAGMLDNLGNLNLILKMDLLGWNIVMYLLIQILETNNHLKKKKKEKNN